MYNNCNQESLTTADNWVWCGAHSSHAHLRSRRCWKLKYTSCTWNPHTDGCRASPMRSSPLYDWSVPTDHQLIECTPARPGVGNPRTVFAHGVHHGLLGWRHTPSSHQLPHEVSRNGGACDVFDSASASGCDVGLRLWCSSNESAISSHLPNRMFHKHSHFKISLILFLAV